MPKSLNKISVSRDLKSFKDTVSQSNKDFKRLRKLIKDKSVEQITKNKATLEHLFLLTFDLIPIAKQVYKKTPNNRSANSLVGLTNQLRELVNDLNSLSDQSQLGDRILETILQPNLTLIAQQSSVEVSKIKRKVHSTIKGVQSREKIEKLLDQFLKHQVNYFQEVGAKVSEQTEKLLDTQ